MNVACPQCGNPNLDVDPQTNTVYCRQCGFAVQVDPQTGNVTPISQGGAPGGAMPMPAQGGMPQPAGGFASKSLFGMDPLTFFLFFTALGVLLFFIQILSIEYLFLVVIVLFVVYWYNH